MSRVNSVPALKVNHEIKFRSLIRGDRCYKEIWTPMKGETLPACHDRREDASDMTNFALEFIKKILIIQ